MQKKKGEIDGFRILVFIAETAIKDPKRYAPLSPRNICAFGKLNLRTIRVNKLIKNKIYERLLFSLIKLITNKIIKIINECIPNKPLNPSMRLAPLTINKKHKHTKNNAKISISNRLFKKDKPLFSI